ncbi:MAG: hypothetical protein AB7H48_13255, partial [Parachlamydiales bacterium]
LSRSVINFLNFSDLVLGILAYTSAHPELILFKICKKYFINLKNAIMLFTKNYNLIIIVLNAILI